MGSAEEIAPEPLVQLLTVMVEVTVEAEVQCVEVVHAHLLRDCALFRIS